MQVEPYTHLTALEDGLRDGGIGSWLMEALADTPALLARLRAEALDLRVCGTVASQTTLNAWGGLEA